MVYKISGFLYSLFSFAWLPAFLSLFFSNEGMFQSSFNQIYVKFSLSISGLWVAFIVFWLLTHGINAIILGFWAQLVAILFFSLSSFGLVNFHFFFEESVFSCFFSSCFEKLSWNDLFTYLMLSWVADCQSSGGMLSGFHLDLLGMLSWNFFPLKYLLWEIHLSAFELQWSWDLPLCGLPAIWVIRWNKKASRLYVFL